MDSEPTVVPPTGQRSYLAALARQVLLERGFQVDLEPAAAAQVAAIGGPAQPVGPVDDLRSLPWCSIDNDDSRDLDQLTVAEVLPGGAVRLRVAVADVDALVVAGSPVDEQAQANTTSLYTPAAVFPMLPERLSTDLTSLNPGTDRLAMVAELTVGADGHPEPGTVGWALVHNHAQLAYDALSAWLDGTGPPPPALVAVPDLAANLRLQDRAAAQLRQLRLAAGALTFETGEARAVFDGERLVGLALQRQNRARRLIEDLMVATNETVARFLEARGYASIRRVVRRPARWGRIVEIARGLGHDLPARPDSRALQRFLDQRAAADPLRFPDLSLAVVKLLGSGEYVAEIPGHSAPGHFGLAVRDYAHSTAPNRRYPDLITQRLVKAALAGRPAPYSNDELVALAAHCTAREDEAQRAERQLQKSAAAMFFGEEPDRPYDALVTGVAREATWVRVLDPPADGRLVAGEAGLDVGDRLCVRLVRADVELGHLDFTRC
jgi:exoribonuclease-2